jgi:hypothetical protein
MLPVYLPVLVFVGPDTGLRLLRICHSGKHLFVSDTHILLRIQVPKFGLHHTACSRPRLPTKQRKKIISFWEHQINIIILRPTLVDDVFIVCKFHVSYLINLKGSYSTGFEYGGGYLSLLSDVAVEWLVSRFVAEDLGFKFQYRDRPLWLRFFVVFLSPSR